MGFREPQLVNRHEWDEEAWERFFRREDARMAKFKELFDTLADHPAREGIVMREMGLEDVSTQCQKNHGNCPQCEHRHDCELHEMRRLLEWPENLDDDPEAADILASFEEAKRLPVYQKAHVFSTLLQHYFAPVCEKNACPNPSERRARSDAKSEQVWMLLDAASMVPAQVAGGHGIGYEGDYIRGNIANCKRALSNATRCRECLRQINLPVADAKALVKSANDLCAVLAGWIEALRARAAGPA